LDILKQLNLIHIGWLYLIPTKIKLTYGDDRKTNTRTR